MTFGFQLDEYCERIGYDGPRSATLQTLAAVQLQHAQAIPFENLNPFLRWPVRLDGQSLYRKLVRDQRGGYCFEHNLLLSHALTAMGFHVTGLAARVMWNAPEGAITPRDHMVLLVDIDDAAYVVDVGFGAMTPTGPLRLEPDVVQSTPHEPFRLRRKADAFVMEASVNGAWKALYRFDLQEQFLADYEVTNWYLSNHPESHFVTGLIAGRPARDLRYALRDNMFSVHYVDGNTERRLLTSADELRATLEGLFHLLLPESPEVDAALARLAASSQRSALTAV
jgi:N-hydroxyarylamine O-acetyltransferase